METGRNKIAAIVWHPRLRRISRVLLLCMLYSMTFISVVHAEKAKIGCSRGDVETIRDQVSTEAAKKYLDWICDGKSLVDLSESKREIKEIPRAEVNGGWFDWLEGDTFTLEYGPLGILSSGTKALSLSYTHYAEDNLVWGGGEDLIMATPTALSTKNQDFQTFISNLYILGGYRFQLEDIAEFIPQVRWGQSSGFRIGMPLFTRFSSFSAGATLLMGSGYSFSLLGGYTF